MTLGALVHPTAIVSQEALLGEGVQIGPYSVVGPRVKIGDGTKLSSYVHIEGDTEIGARCTIFPGAVLGAPAQARLSKSVRSGLSIGDDNAIREHVTVHSSMKEGGRTLIGHRNLLMAGAHVAHDCVVGSDITMANMATLGGHVTVEDGAVIGGLVGVHQFVRIGRLAIIGAFSKLVMDAPPFSIIDGRLGKFCGVNAVGLKRAGYSPSRRSDIRKALKILFVDGGNLTRAVGRVGREFKNNKDVTAIVSFIQGSKRGVARAGSPPPAVEE